MSTIDTKSLTAHSADLPDLSQDPGATMRRFSGERVMLQDARMKKGTTFEPHSHHNEQLVLIVEGVLRLDIPDPETGRVISVRLEAGDYMRLPPNMPHGGEALEDCRVIDAFHPPRTTYLGEAEPDPGPDSTGETA